MLGIARRQRSIQVAQSRAQGHDLHECLLCCFLEQRDEGVGHVNDAENIYFELLAVRFTYCDMFGWTRLRCHRSPSRASFPRPSPHCKLLQSATVPTNLRENVDLLRGQVISSSIGLHVGGIVDQILEYSTSDLRDVCSSGLQARKVRDICFKDAHVLALFVEVQESLRASFVSDEAEDDVCGARAQLSDE